MFYLNLLYNRVSLMMNKRRLKTYLYFQTT